MYDKLYQEFLSPLDEYTPVPFWFWNDNLGKEEIIRQINDFKDKGVMGFVIHPRIGIPKEIKYLSNTYMKYVEVAVKEAARLGMVVFLYDEAMYPSGSAHGMVVRDNPEYASRGLKMIEYKCDGKMEFDIQLEDGENLVSVQAVETLSDNQINPENTIKLCSENGRVDFDPPNGKLWSVLVFIETFTGGVIRGIHFGEDDWESEAPPAADLLNFEAMKKFIKLTHECYYSKLGKYFGNTIKAIFTDEPNLMGKRAEKGLLPWTGGFIEWYKNHGNDELDLPFLWFEADNITEAKRKSYYNAIYKRLEMSYYQPISEWCKEHDIAFTGHPHGSDHIGLLKYFDIPGQDVVLRWVAPEDGKALEGEHSTLGKCSSDSARHRGKQRNANECFGCCYRGKIGYNLPAEDMKWYMDWLFVRGVNLLLPHAFYYSTSGERRIGERPPDVGPNNIWWPYYNIISDYIKRMSWLMTDSVNITEVAVLCQAYHLPWEITKPLYQNQIEFNYLESEMLCSPDCLLQGGKVRIQSQEYGVIVVERADWLTDEIRSRLKEFMDMGGTVVLYNPEGLNRGLGKAHIIGDLKEAAPIITRFIQNGIMLSPSNADLRISHVVKEGIHFYLMVNEGDGKIEGNVKLGLNGAVGKWNAWEGIVQKCEVQSVSDKAVEVYIELDRRESLIISIDPAGIPLLAVKEEKEAIHTVMELGSGWSVQGSPVFLEPQHIFQSWTIWPDMARFSGTIAYENSLFLEDLQGIEEIRLNLGKVSEIAYLFVNGKDVGVKMWPPYVFDILDYVKPGINNIRVEVTNSLANRINKAHLESGLLGPVVLEFR